MTKTCFRCYELLPLTSFYTKIYGTPDTYCKPCRNFLAKQYRNSRKGKLAIKRKTIKFRLQNPLQRSAHYKVQSALRSGALKKGVCAFCGKDKVHAHHENYWKPLEVIWVCEEHHRFIHKYKAIIAADKDIVEVDNGN